IYEVSEGYASVMLLKLDGSDKNGGTVIFHAIYGDDAMPEVGISALVADDTGLVVGVRTDDGDDAKGSVSVLSPDGSTKKDLGTLPANVSALALADTKVYVGTLGGDVFVANRSGSGSLTKVASGEGEVSSIVVDHDDVFFGT